ncbi:MAG: hypothetical protein IK104_11335 [Clostridia bacterium]|nr:hypothetical protein [Clostridia bacterium]
MICVLLSLLLTVSMLAACVGAGKTDSGATDGSAASDGSSAAPEASETPSDEPSEEPSEAPTEPAPVRPTADGQSVEAYDVSFYLPESLTANEWNGMLGVYDFYTGEYVGTRPTGLDISLTVSDESTAEGDLEAYAIEDSRTQSQLEAEPETVELNGYQWIKLSEDGEKANYYAIFNGGLYEIETLRGGDTAENYAAAVEMLEATLFFAVAED